MGTLSGTDIDAGHAAALTFSLVSGIGDTDNASFTVMGTALRTAASFDFEAQDSRSVRLRATDPTVLLAAALPAATPVILTETYHFPIGRPAGNLADTGVATVFSQSISGSQSASLTAVRVGLHLTGSTAGAGWAGDLFVSLNRDLGSQTAVLLNQVGVSGGDPAGFGHDGWDVTFRDDATANGDVHLGQPAGLATRLTGAWQPDGRLSPADLARPGPRARRDRRPHRARARRLRRLAVPEASEPE